MKKLLSLVVLVLAWVVILDAQTETGKLLIGTSTNFYGTTVLSDCPNTAGLTIMSTTYKYGDSSESSNSVSLNITPRVGLFVVDRFLVGIEGSFALLNEDNLDDNITYASGGLFVRYYLAKTDLKPFAQATTGVGQLKFTAEDITNVFNYGGGLGLAYFLSDKVSLDFMASYYHATMKDKDAVGNARILNDGVGLGFGLSIFL